MSLIKIDGVQSLSAPTKAQKDAAIYMLGSKGHAIVSVLDKLSRAKEIRAPHLAGLLKLMKDGTDEEIIKFVASAAGKKTLLNAKAFATAKTLATSIKALRLIRVPQKWIEGHSDAAAARITETKEIRARRTAGNKPEKPIKLDNPHAPEAEVKETARTARPPKKTKVPASMKDVTAPKATTIKQPKALPASKDPASHKYQPSGKSDATLVDELAEVPARKISAKPIQAREEYFIALRNMLQKNLPSRSVSALPNGVVVTGKREHIITLDNNAWFIKAGITGKQKRIGATFDIVDLLAMIDKSILKPKA